MTKTPSLVAISGFAPIERRLISGIFKVSASRPRSYAPWNEESGAAPDFYLLRQAHAEARADWERWIARFDNPQAPILTIGTAETRDCRILAERLGREIPFLTKPIVALRLLEAMDRAVEALETPITGGIRDDISLDELHNLAMEVGHGPLAGRRALVLVVDDSASVRMQMEIVLNKQHGLRTDYAVDGRSALRKLQGREYALIFLDVMLPDMDGFEICRRIKRELRLAAPVVMMTSRNTKRDRMQGVLVEADDYLVKPVQHQELEAVLGKYLG